MKMKTDHVRNESERSVKIFYQCTIFMKMKDEISSWDSVVSTMTRPPATQSRVPIPAGARDFPFPRKSKLALESKQPHIQRVVGLFPWQ